LSKRLTISRTLPSSSASAWCVARMVSPGEQQLGQALVEAVKSDFLDQLHQFGDAFGEKVENEVAEAVALFGDQFLEQGDRQSSSDSGVSAMPRAE
jgi:hypothetical protein